MHAINEPAASDAEHLFDESAFRNTLESKPDEVLPVLKAAVTRINEGLKSLYQRGDAVEDIVLGRASLVDRLLVTLFEHYFADIAQPVALLAVGGYGRGELHPASDIDLMVLLQDEEDASTQSVIEQFIMLLWDARLEIGHSVRTLAECAGEALNDITVATNILEARLLAGDRGLFDQMQVLTGPDRMWDAQTFFTAKLKEQRTRFVSHRGHDLERATRELDAVSARCRELDGERVELVHRAATFLGVRPRTLTSSRLAAARNAMITAAPMTGAATRVRAMPAAIKAVSSL